MDSPYLGARAQARALPSRHNCRRHALQSPQWTGASCHSAEVSE